MKFLMRLFFWCAVLAAFSCNAQMRRHEDSLRKQVLLREAQRAGAANRQSLAAGSMQDLCAFCDYMEEPLEDQIKLLFDIIFRLSQPLRRPGLLGVIGRTLEEDPRLLMCRNAKGQTPLEYAASLGISEPILEQLRVLFNQDSSDGAAGAADENKI